MAEQFETRPHAQRYTARILLLTLAIVVSFIGSLVLPLDASAAGCSYTRHLSQQHPNQRHRPNHVSIYDFLDPTSEVGGLDFANHRRWQYIAGQMVLVFQSTPQWDPDSTPCVGPSCRPESEPSNLLGATTPTIRGQLVAQSLSNSLAPHEAGIRHACDRLLEIGSPFFDALLRPPSHCRTVVLNCSL